MCATRECITTLIIIYCYRTHLVGMVGMTIVHAFPAGSR
jgi:hypothetical protein